MQDFITICKQRTTDALDRFLLDLRFVPAERLTWKPTPTAKSALEIAAHCAGYSGAFASIISTGKFLGTERWDGHLGMRQRRRADISPCWRGLAKQER
jgi:hypothetical protein